MTGRTSSPGIAVIGGGWAGCAAALTLAEAGVQVTLYEASRTLGGRARAVALDGRSLDNGQHILLGAYEQTLQLIDRLSLGSSMAPIWRLPLTLEQPPEFRLACPRLPAPLHLLAGLLGARGLGWSEKLSAIRWAHGLLKTQDTLDGLSVSQLTARQPDRLRRLLWHPLCISALNTAPEIASARVFRDVIRGAFGGNHAHSDLVLPRVDLTELFPARAADRLVAHGGTVRLSSRVTALSATATSVSIGTREDTATFDRVILAVPPQHLPFLAGQVPELAPASRIVSGYAYEPIATGYIEYDPGFRLDQPMFALADGPAQFVFDRGQSHGQPGLMAFVVSAGRDLRPDWLDQTEAQLGRIARPGPARWRKTIVEKQATYACTPGMARPDVKTAHPRIFLAGDYTAGPYPATLESATRSGVQSASELLEQL